MPSCIKCNRHIYWGTTCETCRQDALKAHQLKSSQRPIEALLQALARIVVMEENGHSAEALGTVASEAIAAYKQGKGK